jgi:hypothetical protein
MSLAETQRKFFSHDVAVVVPNCERKFNTFEAQQHYQLCTVKLSYLSLILTKLDSSQMMSYFRNNSST